MHVAIVGAGALGAAYGVRLAVRAKVDVTFVVRAARVWSTTPIVIERVKDGMREAIDVPGRSASVPESADVVLLAVGTEDLEAIRALLDASDAPIVILTPMLPKDWQRVRAAFGERAHAAMPSFVSYANDEGTVRYWLPPVETRIDEPRAGSGAGSVIRALARELEASGIRTHLELGVHETNPATTVCFIPIAMAIALAGSFEALAKDTALVQLASQACSEGSAIARTIGRPEPPALLAPLIAQPMLMRALGAGLRRFSPEGLHYLEVHFGKKLRAQHVLMAREMTALASERGLAHAALDNLAARLALVRR
jgi:2-dehydropantoate 2-reductase